MPVAEAGQLLVVSPFESESDPIRRVVIRAMRVGRVVWTAFGLLDA